MWSDPCLQQSQFENRVWVFPNRLVRNIYNSQTNTEMMNHMTNNSKFQRQRNKARLTSDGMFGEWCSTINRSTRWINGMCQATLSKENRSKHNNDEHGMKRTFDLSETIRKSKIMLTNNLPMRHMSSPMSSPAQGELKRHVSMKRETVDASWYWAISESATKQARSIGSPNERTDELKNWWTLFLRTWQWH